MTPHSQRLTFEQFMAKALHDPEHGYYSQHIQTVGRSGDFTTAPMLSEAPARAIAKWATRAMQETGCYHLIEVGPGSGKLAAEVLRQLPWPVRWKTQLHLVETSTPLAALQQQRLRGKACHHRTVRDALDHCGGKAVIFSNELVDAFPVRRFQLTDSGWQEIAVTFSPGGHAQETLLPVGPLPMSSSFHTRHSLGQRVEVHESYHHYLDSWCPAWTAGRLLTIDYGGEARSLYHRRPHGTIRAYLLQHPLSGPAIYENIGRQDLTADVNFTDLMDWSRPFISSQNLQSLGSFIQDYGMECPICCDPNGAGSAFLVLDQSR